MAGYAVVPPDPLDAVIHDLVAAFPRDGIRDYTIRIYRDKLADVPIHLLEAAAHNLICTEQRFPTIAQIRTAIAELTLDLPSETEALAEVEAKLRWWHNQHGPRPSMHGAVRDALDHVGGIHAFREATEPAVIRGQFARYYREIRAARIRKLQVGTAPQLTTAEGHRILTP